MSVPSPIDFEKKYRELKVKLDDGTTVQVDVHAYQLNGVNNTSALVAKDALINKMNEERRKTKDVLVDNVSVTAEKPNIARCFMGKGSPASLALTLRLGHRYKLHNARTGLQAYCDANLGLDCNGFVGNYTRTRGLGLGPSDQIEQFRNNGTARNQVGDVQARDILTWKNKTHGFGHIAIVEGLLYGPWDVARGVFPRCVVVESSGGAGLHHSEYTLQAARFDKTIGRTVFTVGRPSGARSEVFIVSLRL